MRRARSTSSVLTNEIFVVSEELSAHVAVCADAPRGLHGEQTLECESPLLMTSGRNPLATQALPHLPHDGRDLIASIVTEVDVLQYLPPLTPFGVSNDPRDR